MQASIPAARAWRRHILSTFLITSIVALGAVACSDAPDTTEPTANADQPHLGGGIVPMCQTGCLDEDPAPSAAGIFLGNDVNTENCFNTQWGSDGDSDYVVDFCERKIAEAFAPELKWAYTYDDVRGEAYWVAGNNGLDGIRVGYLLGYYRDLGSSTFSCGIPPISSLCNPHNGDSEAVFIDATYNLTTKHWVLSHAWYYQHGTPHGFQPHPSKGYATGLEYPAGSGDYPRVWVAEDKHASYATQSSCNSGGAAGSDTCVHNNSSFRVFISSAYNIGSRNDPNLDCVTSRDLSYEYYGGGRTECYWTDKDFRGWVPDSIGGGHANAYTDVLDDMGF